MAYPFSQMPTMREFKDRITTEFGFQVRSPRKTLYNEAILFVAKRDAKGITRIVIIPNHKDNYRLTPDNLRSLCARLDIPLAAFGFDLEEQSA